MSGLMSTLEQTSHAGMDVSVEDMKREIRSLREENCFLKGLHQQLLEECKTYDERRVVILKSQIIQLERQNLLLTDEVKKQRKRHAEIIRAVERGTRVSTENMEPQNTSSDTHQDEVYRELRYLCHQDESLVLMKKPVSAVSDAPHHLLLPFMEDFLRPTSPPPPRPPHPTGMFSRCLEQQPYHLNLDRVSHLESDMCKLRSGLLRAKPGLEGGCDVEGLVVDVERVCERLLTLSLLSPSSPLPTSAVVVDVVDDVRRHSHAALPPLGQEKRAAVVRVLDAVLRFCAHQATHLHMQLAAADAELRYKTRLNEVYRDNYRTASDCVVEAYREFLTNLRESIITPCEVLQRKSECLTLTPTSSSLKDYLETCKWTCEGLVETMRQLQGEEGRADVGTSAIRSLVTELEEREKVMRRKMKEEVDGLRRKIKEDEEEFKLEFLYFTKAN